MIDIHSIAVRHSHFGLVDNHIVPVWAVNWVRHTSKAVFYKSSEIYADDDPNVLLILYFLGISFYIINKN